MRIGIFGPPQMMARCENASLWAEVQWGSDDAQSVVDKLSTGTQIDVLVIDGSLQYLNSPVVEAARQAEIPMWALADDARSSDWIDALDGIRRVTDLNDMRPIISPIAASPSQGSGRAEPHMSAHIQHPKAANVVAVWGVVGAPGISTVSISIAAIAAHKGLSVVLCDADTRGASLAIGLGLIDEVPGFAAACRLAGRGELTETEIQRLTERASQGGIEFDFLSGLPRAWRWAEIAPHKSKQVLALLREMYDLVVVDVGFGIEENEWIDGAPQRDGAATSILIDADTVIAVGACDAVGISRLIRGLDDLARITDDPIVVLNNATRLSGREARDALERFTSHRVAATVARDGRGGLEDAMAKANSSMNQLWPVVEARMRSGQPVIA